MTTTVLRTVQCRACGHRVPIADAACPYCRSEPRAKPRRFVPAATPALARPIGRCDRCGGRMRRHRSLFSRMLERVGIHRRDRHARLSCSACGHVERPS